MLRTSQHLLLNGHISQPTARAVYRGGRCIHPDPGADPNICLCPPRPRGGVKHLFVSAPTQGRSQTFVCVRPPRGAESNICLRPPPGALKRVFDPLKSGPKHLFVSAPPEGRTQTFVCVRPLRGAESNICLCPPQPKGGHKQLFVSAPVANVYAPMIASPLLSLGINTVFFFGWWGVYLWSKPSFSVDSIFAHNSDFSKTELFKPNKNRRDQDV